MANTELVLSTNIAKYNNSKTIFGFQHVNVIYLFNLSFLPVNLARLNIIKKKGIFHRR